MNNLIMPLKNGWAVNEDAGYVPDQIKARVDTEDWYTECKGYPIIKDKDIKKKRKYNVDHKKTI